MQFTPVSAGRFERDAQNVTVYIAMLNGPVSAMNTAISSYACRALALQTASQRHLLQGFLILLTVSLLHS